MFEYSKIRTPPPSTACVSNTSFRSVLAQYKPSGTRGEGYDRLDITAHDGRHSAHHRRLGTEVKHVEVSTFRYRGFVNSSMYGFAAGKFMVAEIALNAMGTITCREHDVSALGGGLWTRRTRMAQETRVYRVL